MDTTSTAPSRLDRLTADTADLDVRLAELERRVATVVDPVAALHVRTAVRELEELAAILSDPETVVRP